jgi:hypothetical protein
MPSESASLARAWPDSRSISFVPFLDLEPPILVRRYLAAIVDALFDEFERLAE